MVIFNRRLKFIFLKICIYLNNFKEHILRKFKNFYEVLHLRKKIYLSHNPSILFVESSDLKKCNFF